MIAARLNPARLFAVHPSYYGFGWVAFEGPLTPYDWGGVHPRTNKNANCLRRLEGLLERFRPETLVLEAFDDRASRRSPRIVRMCRAIVSLAADRGVQVAIYSRDQIRACFAGVGAKTRYEIAEAVVRHVDALRYWLPKRRKAWESEHRRLSIFSAAALILTHGQLGAAGLFDELDQAA